MKLLWIPVLFATCSWAQFPEPDGGNLRPGTLPSVWITGGPNCLEVPDFQVHEYNPDLFILRESGCIHYEKPFCIFSSDPKRRCSTIQVPALRPPGVLWRN